MYARKTHALKMFEKAPVAAAGEPEKPPGLAFSGHVEPVMFLSNYLCEPRPAIYLREVGEVREVFITTHVKLP
jgi:hypothetical protein